MSEAHFTLEELDRDGAIAEAVEATEGDTRASLLRKGLVTGGGLLAGGALLGLPAIGAAAPSKKGDVAILNFALTLEYLEAEFYKEAVASGALSGPLAQFAGLVARHEQAHVDFLKAALKSAAVKKPKFDFKGTTRDPNTFGATAYVLENTGVAAYSGQATNIAQVPVVKAAVSILTVEARHAGWIGALVGKAPAPKKFDVAKGKNAILKAVQGTGFIVG